MTNPFLDHTGIDMIRGGGTLFVGSAGRVIGPGHFGLLDLGDGVQKFSLITKPTSHRQRRRAHGQLLARSQGSTRG